MLPAVFMKALINRIAAEEGFNLEGDFWQRADYAKDIIDLATTNSGATQLANMDVIAAGTLSYYFYVLLPFNSSTIAYKWNVATLDNYSHFDTIRGVYVAPVDCTFTASGQINVEHGTQFGLTGFSQVNYSFEISLKAGERFTVYVHYQISGSNIIRVEADAMKQGVNDDEWVLVDRYSNPPLPSGILDARTLNTSSLILSNFDAQETAYGMHYGIAENLPDISKKDLFKTVALKYGLIYKTDAQSKAIYAIRFEDVVKKMWSNDFYDWTSKLDLAAERGDVENLRLEFRSGDLGQSNILEWNNDETLDSTAGQGAFAVDDENLVKEKTWAKFAFAASELTALNELTVVEMLRYQAFGDKPTKVKERLNTVKTTTGAINVRAYSKYSVLINGLANNSEATLEVSVNGTNYAVEIEMDNNTIHYGLTAQAWIDQHGKELQKLGIIARASHASSATTGLFYIESAAYGSPVDSVAITSGAVTGTVNTYTNSLFQRTHTGTIAYSDFISGQEIIDEHYSGYQRAMNYYKKVKVKVKLSALDFVNFDHFKPVFINRIGWFYVEKINGFKTKGSTEVEMIMLDNFLQKPAVRFDYTFDVVNDKLVIGNDSAGFISVLWSFGDGTNSYEVSPVKKYAQRGIYSVVLTITDTEGTEHRTSKRVFSRVPNLDFRFASNSIYLAV